MVSPCCSLFESFAYNFALANILATGIAPQEVVFHNELHEQIAVIIHPFWNIWFLGCWHIFRCQILTMNLLLVISASYFGDFWKHLRNNFHCFPQCWRSCSTWHGKLLIDYLCLPSPMSDFWSMNRNHMCAMFIKVWIHPKKAGTNPSPHKKYDPNLHVCCMFWVKFSPHEMPWC